MKYTAEGKRSTQFTLFDSAGASAAEMHFPKWYTAKAQIRLNSGALIQITPELKFLQEIHVTSEGAALFTVKFGWLGKLKMLMPDGREFTFKRMGFMPGVYKLFNENDHEIVSIKPHFNWSKFSHSYTIDTDDNYVEANDERLLLALIYTIISMQRRAAAAT